MRLTAIPSSAPGKRKGNDYCFAALFAIAVAMLATPPCEAQPGLALADALREALKQNPNTLLQQQQVIASRGAVLQALGQFDTVFSANATRGRELRPLRKDEQDALQRGGASVTDPIAVLLGLAAQPVGAPPFVVQSSNNIAYGVGVEQPLQAGLTVGGSLGMTTTYDNVSALSQIPPQTSGRIGFTVRAPLLRNAGPQATTANLTAAEAELQAASYDLVFTNAQALLGTTLAYWDYLARVRRLEIARDAEQRAMRLVEEIKKLIRDDQVPAADIQLVSASYTERLAARIGAEQTLTEGRRALALQIGLSPGRAAEMPLPVDEFPALDEQAAHVDTKIVVLREDAIGRRADLEAARQREQSARRRLIAARSGLKPQLDVSLGVNYTSLMENRVPFAVGNVMGTNLAGPSILATLAAQLPARNSAAEGTFLAASAGLDASSIRVNSLMDTIGNNVSAGALGLARAALQLVQSIETTRYYRLSVENERTKRRLGLATLIDVINVEDRLTNALLAEVQARQSYASAIAQLRFEVGTLVIRRDDRFDVDVDSLFNPRFDTMH